MSDLYMMGAQAINYFSKCGITRTSDLVTFQPAQSPQVPHTHIQSGVRSPSSQVVMTTNAGSVITTPNFQDYSVYDVDFKQSQFQKVTWNQGFVAVGFKRNTQLQEQAHVWTSDSAFDQFSWPAAFLIQDAYSAFTHVTNLPGQQVATVGYALNLTRSLLATGSYSGGWQTIQLPDHVQGGLWSITYAGGFVWIGGRGWVARASLNNLGVWTRTDLTTSHTVTHILFNAGKVYALAGDQVFVSVNGVDYSSVKFPGHTLTVAHVHDGQVVLGSHSLLTQSDLFVWDMTSQTWLPKQSQVHAYAFVSI